MPQTLTRQVIIADREIQIAMITFYATKVAVSTPITERFSVHTAKGDTHTVEPLELAGFVAAQYLSRALDIPFVIAYEIVQDEIVLDSQKGH